MDLRKIFCSLALLTAVVSQPALAGAPAAKPAPATQTLQLATVPMKAHTAEDLSASVTETTRQENVGFRIEELLEPKACPSGGNATFTWKLIDGCQDGWGI